MNRFFIALKDSIKRGILNYDEDTDRNCLTEVRNLFEEFSSKLEKEEFKQDIKELIEKIEKYSGVHKIPFTSPELYENILSRSLKDLRTPCLDCFESVYELIHTICKEKMNRVLKDLPAEFRTELFGIVLENEESVFKKCREDTLAQIETLLKTQTACVYSHKDFEMVSCLFI